jgi:hypothetical protein
MRTEGRTATVVAIALAATLLLWPALWNGYPLVFSDTGTYLSQAIEHYAGWDRPVFYSLFLLPLHLTLTTWPAIAVPALLVAHVLHLLRRTLLPDSSVWWLLPLAGAMTLTTSLPWFASQLMPDVFTGVLVLVLALLIFAAEHLSARERVWLVAFAAFMIAAHQSHVLLASLLLAVLLPLRGLWGATALRSVAPLALAVAALISVNLIAFGRASLSPFGNVFLLTRVIYDGPGADVLRRDCPASGWRLCAFIDRLPAIADDFLWREDGPVVQAGGARLVAREADAIIVAALRAEPGRELLAFTQNTAWQLATFATGDGLRPWPATVTPRIERDFPRFEAATFAASRQNSGALAVPSWLQTLHFAAALAGVAGCVALLLTAPRGASLRVRGHGQHPAVGFAAAALLALLANAAITGGLSGPHDRYQSRVMWLPPLVAVLGIASLRTIATPVFSR